MNQKQNISNLFTYLPSYLRTSRRVTLFLGYSSQLLSTEYSKPKNHDNGQWSSLSSFGITSVFIGACIGCKYCYSIYSQFIRTQQSQRTRLRGRPGMSAVQLGRRFYSTTFVDVDIFKNFSFYFIFFILFFSSVPGEDTK